MDKIIAITGAGGVLCSAFAAHLAKNGARVALLDINAAAAEAAAERINKDGGRAAAFYCDCLDRASVEAAHAAVLSAFGPCDALINGAGGNSPRATTAHETYTPGDEEEQDALTFFGIPAEGFDFVFDLNLKGVLLPSQVFIPDMLQGGGSVLNISSMNAYRPLTKIPAYSAAKAAVSNLTQWMAVHFAGAGIRVNAIAPGFFVTGQNRALLFDENGAPTPRTDKILRATPMGRFGRPEELLGAVGFLLDEQASGFVTGVTLPIDGGFSAYAGV